MKVPDGQKCHGDRRQVVTLHQRCHAQWEWERGFPREDCQPGGHRSSQQAENSKQLQITADAEADNSQGLLCHLSSSKGAPGPLRTWGGGARGRDVP